jgi:hypothetical protein
MHIPRSIGIEDSNIAENIKALPEKPWIILNQDYHSG